MNHIVFWTKLLYKTIWVEPYCLLVIIFLKDHTGCTILSFAQYFVKRQYGLNHIVFWSKLWKKTIWVESHYPLVKIFLNGHYGFNHFNFCSKFSFKTISVESYCLLVRTFKKDNMGWNILCLGHNFQKRQCWLKHIVFWSKLSKKTM